MSDIYSEDTVFDQTLPKEPYNLDIPPPQYTIGPLKAVFSITSKAIAQYSTDVAEVKSQLSVQNATGIYLDAHGVLYNTPRLDGELDGPYRTRILAALKSGKLTIPAIQAAVNAYLVSRSSAIASSTPPTAYVYDLQSDPDRCKYDAANSFPIQIFWFVVEIDSTILEDDVFFLDYSYLTNPSGTDSDPLTLYAAGTSYDYTGADTDPLLVETVRGVKAGDTRAIYKTVVTIDTSVPTG